jgi:hypothetical protein
MVAKQKIWIAQQKSAHSVHGEEVLSSRLMHQEKHVKATLADEERTVGRATEIETQQGTAPEEPMSNSFAVS